MLSVRSAFSLVELLVGVVIACAIATAVMDSGLRLQRHFAAFARIAGARAAVKQAADVLSADLRPVTPRDGDLYATAPDHVDFRMLLGASLLCTIAPARDAAVLPPTRAASALGLTAWVAPPLRGDTVLVLDEGGAAAGDEHWARHVLTADPAPGGNCPVASGFAANAAESAAGWSVALSPPLAITVRPGAAVRFVRRARFELYQAADSRWYLGFLDCLATRATPCATVQPVSGPYDAGGIRFDYLDSAGAAASPSATALIAVTLRASVPGAATGGAPWSDSARALIAPRN